VRSLNETLRWEYQVSRTTDWLAGLPIYNAWYAGVWPTRRFVAVGQELSAAFRGCWCAQCMLGILDRADSLPYQPWMLIPQSEWPSGPDKESEGLMPGTPFMDATDAELRLYRSPSLTRAMPGFMGQAEGRRVTGVVEYLKHARRSGSLQFARKVDARVYGKCLVCTGKCHKGSPLCKTCHDEYGDSPNWPAWLHALRAFQEQTEGLRQKLPARSLDYDTDPLDENMAPILETLDIDPNDWMAGPRHGAVATYKGGCRCWVCKKAWAKYMRARRAKKEAA
jgi:hypothetical protein